jgi:hypothetical protein
MGPDRTGRTPLRPTPRVDWLINYPSPRAVRSGFRAGWPINVGTIHHASGRVRKLSGFYVRIGSRLFGFSIRRRLR